MAAESWLMSWMRFIWNRAIAHVTGAAIIGACLEPFAVDIRLQGEESNLAIGGGTSGGHPFPGPFPGFGRVYYRN